MGGQAVGDIWAVIGTWAATEGPGIGVVKVGSLGWKCAKEEYLRHMPHIPAPGDLEDMSPLKMTLRILELGNPTHLLWGT